MRGFLLAVFVLAALFERPAAAGVFNPPGGPILYDLCTFDCDGDGFVNCMPVFIEGGWIVPDCDHPSTPPPPPPPAYNPPAPAAPICSEVLPPVAPSGGAGGDLPADPPASPTAEAPAGFLVGTGLLAITRRASRKSKPIST